MLDFKGLFSAYITKETLEAFDGAEVNSCGLDKENRVLSLSLKSPRYISNDIKARFDGEVTKNLKLNAVKSEIAFDKSAICDTAIADIIERLRYKNVALNGYFNKAEYSVSGDSIDICLKYGGYEEIKKSGFESSFSREVNALFGFVPNIVFSGQLEELPVEIKEEPKEEKPAKAKAAAPAPEAPKEPQYDYKPKDGLPIYLESAKLFYGRKIDTKVVPLKNIIPPTNPDEQIQICVWGEISNSEIRDVPTRRGGRMVTVKFNFSDGTNTFAANLKKFFDPKYVGDMEAEIARFKKTVKPIKDGTAAVINGGYGFDNWSGNFIVDVKAMATVKKYEKRDTFEGPRRVELHCHTNMSAKDAVSSAGDLINTAYKWGHKAIAITDHGVVQSYPAAAAAVKSIRKSGGDFKVIYGVESYYIDDIRHDISGLSSKEIGKLRNHQVILVKNLVGLKNLYRLVSGAHLNCFHSKPITLRSELDKYREGLIIGSACERGELYRAVVDGKPHEELIEIAKYYDYLEIQPLGNNAFMVRESGMPDKVDKKGNVTIY